MNRNGASAASWATAESARTSMIGSATTPVPIDLRKARRASPDFPVEDALLLDLIALDILACFTAHL
jgi:hypothetical protein